MEKKLRKRTILLITATVFIVATVLYLLADRYLIEKVAIADVNAYASSAVAQASATPVALAQAEATPTASATTEPSYDDWNYTSSNVSISIQKVVNGSGQNQVTYFVADVVVSDATQLQNAFANNQFGQNIIEYTSAIAEENNAIFAINGDYYGFRDNGIIIRNGVIYRDVPVRTGLAFYHDGTMSVYDETSTSAQELVEAGVWNTLSFGPALIVDSVAQTIGARVEIDTNFGNHTIQGNQPRTGIGIISPNHFVFIVVDGRSTGYSRGVSLTEFTQIFQSLGCTDAYNLDGGGSSEMYFMGRVVNNPLGRNKERGTSDILFIGS
jgi:exopolysaccharide biosynthesis protein